MTTTSNPSTLRRDALWNVLGSLIYSGCQWGILVATVKLAPASVVGQLSLGFAISAPIFLLLHLRLRAASATDAGLEFSPADYIVLRVVCTVAALAVTWLACLVSGLPHSSVVVVMWVALAKAIESGSDLMYGLAQQADDLRAVAVSMTVRGVLAGVLFIGLLARTHRLNLALAGLCVAWAVAFLFIDLPRAFRSGKVKLTGGTSLHVLWRLTLLTLPLGASTMFMSLMANMPRYFIEHALGLSALGIFSAAGYLTMTVSIVISAIAESSIAHLSRCFRSGQVSQAAHVLGRVLRITLALSAASIAVSMAFGRTLLKFVYAASYGNAAGLLTGLMLVAAIANVASVYGYALVAARRFVRYLGALAFASVSTAGACAVLIPRWGNNGAIAACLAGYSVQLLGSFLLLRPDVTVRTAGAHLQPAPGSSSAF